LWEAVGEEIDELVEANGRGGANAALATLESELDSEPLDRRVRRRLETRRPPSVRRRGDRFRPVVRPATAADRQPVVDIARELVRSGDTYAYDPAISDAELWSYWRPQRHGDGYVAELGGAVVGAFVIRPNNPGPGAHVANASFAVRADVRGVGLGRAMGRAALGIAEELGYAGMQFNTVVTTNVHAVRLWRSLGFRIVGTVPDGFRLPDGTLVPHHIMYRRLP
jgi:L-amino acid N-acyltransferase YncA